MTTGIEYSNAPIRAYSTGDQSTRISTARKGNVMSDRILFYGASTGRGVVDSIDDDNNIQDVRVIPEGGFAQDWTQITGLSGDRILYYSASTGR
ncbi:hypothetical protein, partial [Nocardia gamkensis]|uniref:hypothetical protein n=2 Tax=Nocardia TaxID=1817 RepID=UPI00379E737C